MTQFGLRAAMLYELIKFIYFYVQEELYLYIIHLTAEPITVAEVSCQGFNKTFNNELSSALVSYDMRTEYAELFGVKGDYQYSCHDSIEAIRHYAQIENKKLEIKNK